MTMEAARIPWYRELSRTQMRGFWAAWMGYALDGFKTALKLRSIITTNITGRPSIQLNDEEVERVRQALIAARLL